MPPYRPNTGVLIFVTTSIGYVGCSAVGLPSSLPYHATAAATFGLCARPSYHGHSYTCDVTVTGDVDPVTGFVADLGVIDQVLTREVRERFDHSNINVDVPEFGEGGLVPTGENLARFICERVQAGLPHTVRVTRVVVAEDATLSATWTAPGGAA